MNFERFECAMCLYSTFIQRHLMYHYVRNHRYDPRFFVACGSRGCGATYKNWNSFKKHIQRHHRGEVDVNDGQIFPDEEVRDEGALQMPVGDQVLEGDHPEVNRKDALQWQAAKFLLQIRDQFRTSHRAMVKVMEGAQYLLHDYASIIMSEITNAADPDTQTISIAAVQHIIQESFPASHIFSNIATKTDLDNFLVSEMNMIPPEEIELGRELVWQRKPVVDLVEKTFKGYSIPLLKSLKRLLLNDQVRFCVENPRHSNGILKTVLDGKYYKNHPFFRTNVNSLAIILYYDELEIVNPLGPKTHKMGMFYWTLANIYPEYRSTLQSINLLAVAKYVHIKKYGLDNVLRSFVADINTLQRDGITIVVNNVEKNYKGSLLMVTGDTPASAFLGGFKESVSKATKPCRKCLTDQDRWKLYFKENQFDVRNKDLHADHVAAVVQDNITAEQRRFWSQFYGVNKRSILMSIDGFDVTHCLVQDIMHVLCEGVFEVATRVFLRFLVNNGFFSLDTLNERIMHFDYGHLIKDKPSLVTRDHLDNSLRQTSAQMLCLSHVVPFLIGDLLTHDDVDKQNRAHERLLCHSRMLQISNMCFAFEISPDHARLMNHLINNYLFKYSQLYPNTMVPKFHFLIHIGNQIIDFGPARQHFCMRFEAAHAWYKGLMRVIRNLKNIPWTFSYRQECLRCTEMSAAHSDHAVKFLYQGHSIKSGLRYKIVDLEHQNLLFEQLHNVERDTCEVMISPEVKVHGSLYRPGSILLLACEEEDLPEFARLSKIYVHGCDIFLLCKPLKTVSYFDTLNAYLVAVDVDSTDRLIRIENLMHPFPLSLFTFKRLKYVVLFNFSRPEFIN